MKNVAVFSAVALLALAGSANAQSSLAGSRLEFRIVPVDGTVAGGLTRPGANADVAIADANRTRRFEVQYRIIAGPGESPAGLSSLQFNVVSSVSGGTVGSDLDRALLTRFQGQTGNLNPGNTGLSQSVGNSDTTGPTANGATGLHRPYRGGIPAPAPNNNTPANGVFGVGNDSINLITPLALAQTDQNDGGFYGLYSFNVIVGPASAGNFTDPDNDGFVTINLAANAIPDGQTLNAFGAFEDQNPVPQTSRNFTPGTISFRVAVPAIPAPGAMALVGLGGLVAARRRRA